MDYLVVGSKDLSLAAKRFNNVVGAAAYIEKGFIAKKGGIDRQTQLKLYQLIEKHHKNGGGMFMLKDTWVTVV